MPETSSPSLPRSPEVEVDDATAVTSRLLQRSGEMGMRVRDFDWLTTPVGPISTWSQSLKTTVGLLLHSPVPMVLLWGADGIMIYNDGYARIAAARHPGLLGSNVREGWPEVSEFCDHFMSVCLGGGTLSYREQELTLFRKGVPESVWFDLDFSPVLDEAGQPAGVIAIVVETTERVRAEKRVAQEGGRLRALFAQAPSFMCVLRGPDHVFELLNDAYLQLVGHRRDLIGKPARAALPEVEGQGFFELLDRVYGTGEPFVGHTLAVKLQRQPGGPIEERFVDLVYQPIVDAGAVTGIFAEGYDVTERVQAETALRDSEARHRQIFNSATDYAIFSTDLDRRITAWNDGARRVLGWTEEEMLGQSADRIFVPEDIETGQPDKEMQAALEHGAALDERWHRRKSGERFWASGELTPLRGDAGKIVGLVKVLRDRTEQRHAKEHQQLLINELNHRVKNTLATVQSLASQTLRGDRPIESMRLIFEGRLLALAKVHDVLTRQHWEGAELREIVTDSLAPFRRDRSAHIELGGPKLSLKPRMALAIAMALHELATNAVKYGALSVPEGRVAIAWKTNSADPSHLIICWEETNGPPVSPPTRRGFGTRLIERSLALELAGSVSLSYGPNGLKCVIETPLPDANYASGIGRDISAIDAKGAT